LIFSIDFENSSADKIVLNKQNQLKFFSFKTFNLFMVEPLLSGIVLGLVPVTLAGLFVTAYLQYRRGDRVTSSL
jgi:cytochrome b6-f complex subunit 5